MRIRLSGGGAAGGEGAAAGVATRGSEPTVWVLYPDRVLVCVGVEALVTLARQHMEHQAGSPLSYRGEVRTGDPNGDPEDNQSPPRHSAGPSFAKLQLEGQDEILDVVACPAPAGLFEVRPERHSHVILASGVSPALAFYPIGSESRSFGLASIAWAVASRVTSLTVGALDGLFGFVGLRGRGRKAAAAKAKAQRRGGANGDGDGDDASGGGGSGGGEDSSPAPLVLRWDGGLQDGWRRVSRLCLDPSGRLAAAADGFGRVMLVDCATRQILRMWKGVRDAECGWLEIVESWEGRRVASVAQNKGRRTAATAATAGKPPGEAALTPVVGLYLAILAPLRGRVELWRMRHGPCVRVIPAPADARLLTSRPNVFGFGEGAGGVDVGGKGRDAETLTSCYLLSGGAAGGTETTRLRLSPLSVEEEDLADLPNRLSREPTVDDAYRLRKFAAALTEMRSHGTGSTTTLSRAHPSAPGERGRLPAGREAREDFLLQLLSQLESVESLAHATAALGGARLTVPPTAPTAPGRGSSRPDGKVELSASFQRRCSALCRVRTKMEEEMAPEAEPARADDSRDGARTAAAVSSLCFRAAAFELYTVLESVKLDPAREDEDEDPAFLPPGKRGWKHAALCEEAAGWADMVRRAGGALGVPSAELPDFEEFLETVSVVLEVEDGHVSRRATSSLGGRETSPALLRFVTLDSSDLSEGKPAPAVDGARTRRTSRDSASSIDPSLTRQASLPLKGDSAAAVPADWAAEYARCRTRLIGWLFRPLLSDAFALASLTQALSLLGLGSGSRNGGAAGLIQDLAAWFLALPVGRAADTTVGREAQNCPVLRWLKAVILAWASSSLSPPSSSSSSRRSALGGRDRGGDAGPLADDKGQGMAATAGADQRMADLFGDPVEGSVGSPAGKGGGVFGDGDSDGGDSSGDGGGGDASSSMGGSEGGREDGSEVAWGGGKGNAETMRADAEEILRPMFEACAASQRLENASMLSVVTAEALAACREKLEESSLGQVAISGGEEWVTLARRVRLCLFVDHRLHPGVPPEQRDRASVKCFVEGKASVYSLVGKDQLMSFRDLSFPECSSRERAEVEASARSQRQTAEARAAAVAAAAADGGGGRLAAEQRRRFAAGSAATKEESAKYAVAAAPSLADPQMDEHWSAVQAVAARVPNAPKMAALGAASSSSLSDSPEEPPHKRVSKPGRERKASPRATSGNSSITTATGSTGGAGAAAAAAGGPLPAGSFPETPPTTLFFMRSHAQPTILACHRTRWLVLSWASAGPASAEALQRATDPSSLAESVRAAEGAVRRLSLAVDHLSYLRTARPLLAGCVAYWLWEHGGVRTHVGRLARGGIGHGNGCGEDNVGDGGASVSAGSGAADAAALVEEGRPAREAFLTAAEEFLKVEALFHRPRDGADRGMRGGVGGGGGGGPAGGRGGGGEKSPRSGVSFTSLLTEGAMQRCPWPGAWDRWVEECLRDAQVHPPLQPAVAAHSTLLRALRVNTVCGLPEGDTLGLFDKGHILCAEASLRNALLSSPAAPGPGEGRIAAAIPGGGGGAGDRAEGARHVVARRESYIRRALDAVVPRPAQNVYRLARDFGVSEDTVRGWHCLVLLKRGHDVLGEEALSQIFSLQDLAGDILTIMRLRLKRFLNFLETSPRAWRGLLASLDADTCQWVRSARDPEATARGGAQSEKEAGEPLRSTHGVLLCLARALPGDSRHKRQANALVTLVGTMLQHLGRGGAGGGGFRR
ncbi:unnamed protein product [Scytosiphon promiscuus]